MKIWMALGLAMTVMTAACMEAEMPEAEEGQALYAENCAMCHGPAGRGDGEVAARLEIKPTDLTQISRQNGGPFPRAEVMSQIDGYMRGEQSVQDMPEFGLLLKGPTVPVDVGDGVMTPTPRPLAALMEYLESIQQ